jgi:hypothetical protein
VRGQPALLERIAGRLGRRARRRGRLPDRLTNREPLAALSHCYSVTLKPAAQSEADFVAEHWTPLADAWRASHPAGSP